jgi:hypothetical protein
MATQKITAFYNDPVKRACDRDSLSGAFSLRARSTEPGATWAAGRTLRYLGHRMIGTLEQVRNVLPPRPLIARRRPAAHAALSDIEPQSAIE